MGSSGGVVPSMPWWLQAARKQAAEELPIGVSLALLSKSRFVLSCDPYNARIDKICRDVAGAQYGLHKCLQVYKRFHRWAESVDDTLVAIPTGIALAFAKNSVYADEPRPLGDIPNVRERIPQKLLDALYPFQREGVAFALSREGRCLFGDDMGLGKTLQALAVTAYYRQDWPALIVCPSSLRLQWADCIDSWLGVTNITTVLTGKVDVSVGDFVIVSYDLLSKMKDALKARGFGLVIADESHMLKSRKALRTKSARTVLMPAARRILLTGTPALSRPSELYSQVEIIDRTLFSNYHNYSIRYCNGHQGHFGWDDSGSSNSEELHTILENTLMIRRLKKDVLHDLPPKTRQKVHIGIAPEHARILEGILREIQTAKLDMLNLPTPAEKNEARFRCRRLIMELYKATGTAKIPLVLEYVREKLDAGVKFVVFAHHQDVVDAVCSMLIASKVDHIRIDGGTAAARRSPFVAHFQEDEACRVAVLSITAAGVGLNLTAAKFVVFAEMFWNPGALRQAEDRAHRIGQTDSVLVQYLVARNTVDDLIWALVDKKLDILGATLDGQHDEHEATSLEGKKTVDDGSVVDEFLQDVFASLESFPARFENWASTKRKRKREADSASAAKKQTN